MTVHSIHIFNKKCECIYFTEWNNAKTDASKKDKLEPAAEEKDVDGDPETAKLVYGVVFSLRNMANKL
ncbi:hypothetical protein HDU77_009927, partial [Chytriomyces hyalinus]